MVAFVTMGVALWRGGRVARWLALLFSVASLVAAVGPPGLLGVVMAAPFIVVMFLLAGQIKSDARQEPAPSRLAGRHCRPLPTQLTGDPRASQSRTSGRPRGVRPRRSE